MHLSNTLAVFQKLWAFRIFAIIIYLLVFKSSLIFKIYSPSLFNNLININALLIVKLFLEVILFAKKCTLNKTPYTTLYSYSSNHISLLLEFIVLNRNFHTLPHILSVYVLRAIDKDAVHDLFALDSVYMRSLFDGQNFL